MQRLIVTPDDMYRDKPAGSFAYLATCGSAMKRIDFANEPRYHGLACFARPDRLFHCGDTGAGCFVKLAKNLVEIGPGARR